MLHLIFDHFEIGFEFGSVIYWFDDWKGLWARR